jgi:hypothetical protein
MKLKTPSSCPACGGEYETTVLTCKKCHSQLSGNFSGCAFCKLSDEDANFLLTFVKCRGSIKDVEKELGISYPTVRGKLDTVIKNLGFVDNTSQAEIKKNRKGIFDKLSQGEISADQAAEMLKNS